MDPAMALLDAAERWCLGGGEDFELVLALEPGWAAALQARLPGAREIGHLVAGSGQVRWLENGEALPGESAGFTHFR
jgi:thiamine-monophosphate kinase